MFLLDTNVCLDFLLARNERVVHRLEEEFERCAISTISVAELRVGSRTSHDPVRDEHTLDLFLDALAVEAFDERAAERYGELVRGLPMKRTSFDRLIGAHALALDAVLITSNARDFSDIPGLRIENWATE